MAATELVFSRWGSLLLLQLHLDSEIESCTMVDLTLKFQWGAKLIQNLITDSKSQAYSGGINFVLILEVTKDFKKFGKVFFFNSDPCIFNDKYYIASSDRFLMLQEHLLGFIISVTNIIIWYIKWRVNIHTLFYFKFHKSFISVLLGIREKIEE